MIRQGQDTQAAKLAGAAADDANFRKELKDQTLSMAALAAFRAKNVDAMTSILQARLIVDKSQLRTLDLEHGDDMLIAALWHSAAGRAELISPKHLELLKATRRGSSPAMAVRDIATIATALNSRAKGGGSRYIDAQIAATKDESFRTQLRELRKSY